MGKQGGFVALITVIIISAVLLAVACAIGGAGVLHRLNVAGSENSEESKYLAEACGYKALLNLAYDKNYRGSETLSLGTDTCTIEPIPPPIQNKITLYTNSQISENSTRLSIVAGSSNLSIISWQQVP